MYAETDFILALIKDPDWLKTKAEKLYNEYKNQIWSSQITLQELMLYSHKNKINPVNLIEEASQLIRIRDVQLGYREILTAAHIMEKYFATPFDALHAVIAMPDGFIMSSDSIYDKIGLQRIKIE